MRIFCWLLLGTLNALAYEEPLLPEWSPKEREQLESMGWVAGGLLLTNDPVPDEAEAQKEAPLAVEAPSAGEIADEATPSPEIAEKYLPAYFAERPTSFLIDPQGLLSAADYRDRLSFLTYHASDSAIDLYVYVIGGNQEIPGQVREEEMIERFFSEGRPAAIVFYYLGMPQRSEVYLSPSITDEISAAEQQRALASSVMQAFEKLNPAEQIESFLVQMSIRIYWMERMLGGAPAPSSDEVPIADRRLALKRGSEHAKGESIAAIQAKAMKYAGPAGIGMGGFCIVVMVGYWLRRRARYRFPEFDVEPRLGGAHAAGVGAVISFASANLPPASQRDQVPDYLRRA